MEIDVIRCNYTFLCSFQSRTSQRNYLCFFTSCSLCISFSVSPHPRSARRPRLLSSGPATASRFCGRALLSLAPPARLPLVDRSPCFPWARPRSPSGVCLLHCWASLRPQNALDQGLGFLFPSPSPAQFYLAPHFKHHQQVLSVLPSRFLNPSTSSSCTACSSDLKIRAVLGIWARFLTCLLPSRLLPSIVHSPNSRKNIFHPYRIQSYETKSRNLESCSLPCLQVSW